MNPMHASYTQHTPRISHHLLSLTLSVSISLFSSPFGVQTSTLSSQTEADSPWRWCRQEAHPCLCRANCQVVKVLLPFLANSNEKIMERWLVETRGGAGSGGALSDAMRWRNGGAAAAWTSFKGSGDASRLRLLRRHRLKRGRSTRMHREGDAHQLPLSSSCSDMVVSPLPSRGGGCRCWSQARGGTSWEEDEARAWALVGALGPIM